MKKRTLLLMATLGMAISLTACGSIEQTAKNVTVEAGQELNLVATDFFDIDEKKAGDVSFDTSKVDVNTVGEYTATATYREQEFPITVMVEDTTAPEVTLKQRYAFTNDITAYDPVELVDGIYDASEYTTVLTRFEKSGNLDALDDDSIRSLVNTITIPCDQEALKTLGTEEIPTEEGIYQAVLAVTDAAGNARLEEVCIILDKTGALIDDVADKTIEVDTADIDKEPEINPEDYIITDNVDGKIPADDITCELELTDEANHQYTVHVSYTDRAGNESKSDFIINVSEKKQEVASNDSGSSSGSSGGSSSSGSDSGSTDNSGGGDTGSGDVTGYGDATVQEILQQDPSYYETHLTPDAQAAVNAGYYNIVPAADGDGYVILTHCDDDSTSYGGELLRNYVHSLGYNMQGCGGSIISDENDQYYFKAYGLYEIDESLNEW